MSRKAKGDFVLIVLGMIVAAVVAIVSAIISVIENLVAFIMANQIPVGITAAVLVAIPIAYFIFEGAYFRSQKFKEIKNGISTYTANCNDLNNHIS